MFTVTTTITREQLDDILGAAGYDARTVREDYSGRGMYGAKCLGFTVSRISGALQVAAAMGAVLGADEAREILRSAATDSMGRDTIVYFPGLTLSD